MRTIGLMLAFTGIVAGLYAFNMEISVRAPNGAMIHNLELAGERLLVAIFASAVFVSGAVTFGFGEVVQRLEVRESSMTEERSSPDVPIYFRYDPQLIVGFGLVILAACGLAAWFFTKQ